MLTNSFQAAALIRGRKPQILFAHDAYPGQFGALARWLARDGWQVWALTHRSRTDKADHSGIRIIPYAPHRAPAPATHPYAQSFDRAVLTGQAALRACIAARANGLNPDLIVSHAGPGTGLFLRDLFSEAAQTAYCEWWYNHPGPDTAYLADLAGQHPDQSPEAAVLEHSRNAPISAELLAAGQGLCPTAFQTAQFPKLLRAAIETRHDGVDCARFSPGAPGPVLNPTLARLTPDVSVVSYATRGMEPHRGFPQVAEAFAALQRADARVVAVFAGGNRVHYGSDAARKVDWKARVQHLMPLDPDRTIFTGMLNADDYRWLLRRTNAHVYATVPFVPSWSLLDAMATETPLVLSDTTPVREFADETCARFADLSRPMSFKAALEDVLNDRPGARARAGVARQRILECYDAAKVHPETARWLTDQLLHRAPARPRLSTAE